MHTIDEEMCEAPGAPEQDVVTQITAWSRELGFQEVGVADTDLSAAEGGLLAWLAGGHHGEMDYMARHGVTRARPGELLPGTIRVITVRMNYRTRDAADPDAILA